MEPASAALAMSEVDIVAEYWASGARDDYECALRDADEIWEHRAALRSVAETRSAGRSRKPDELRRALAEADDAIRDLRSGEYDEFNPLAVPDARAAVERLAGVLERVRAALAAVADLIALALVPPAAIFVPVEAPWRPLVPILRRPASPHSPPTAALTGPAVLVAE